MYLIFLLLSATASQSVFSLECYTTDLTSIDAQNINAAPVPRDCKDFFSEYSDYEILEEQLRCYTVTADSDRTAINIQGCTLREDCSELKDAVRNSVSKTYPYYYKFDCEECDSDLCNSGVTRTIAFKRWFSATYLAISLVAIIVVIVLTTLVLYYFKNRAANNARLKKIFFYCEKHKNTIKNINDENFGA